MKKTSKVKRINWKAPLRAAVARGARFLDRKDPKWWKNGKTPNGIDLDKLELSSAICCVLGQRGGYATLTNLWFKGSNREAGRYGFNIYSSPIDSNEAWSFLTELWVAVITARRFPRRKSVGRWEASLRLPKKGAAVGTHAD